MTAFQAKVILVFCVTSAGSVLAVAMSFIFPDNAIKAFSVAFLPVLFVLLFLLVCWLRCPECGYRIGWHESWGGRFLIKLFWLTECPRCGCSL